MFGFLLFLIVIVGITIFGIFHIFINDKSQSKKQIVVESDQLETPYTSQTKEIIKLPNSYPYQWGNPPTLQTKDNIKLPNPYGYGSSTLNTWIDTCQKFDKYMIRKLNDYQNHGSQCSLEWVIPEELHYSTVKKMFDHYMKDFTIVLLRHTDFATTEHQLNRIRLVYHTISETVKSPVKVG